MAILENIELTGNSKQTENKQPVNNQPKVEPIEFERAEFKAASISSYSTTRALGSSIARTLRRISDDVVTCVVYPDVNTGAVVATLVLTNKAKVDGKVKFVTTADQQRHETKGILAKMTDRANNDFRSLLTLTDEGKGKLAALIPQVFFRKNNPVFNFTPDGEVVWNNATRDFVESNYATAYGAPVAYKAVQFDLTKYFAEIYGRTNDKGDKFTYQISVIRPENKSAYPVVNNKYDSYVIQITQINDRILEDNYNVTNGVDDNQFYPSFMQQFK